MKDFFNRYMATTRSLQGQSKEALVKSYSETVATVLEGIGRKAFRPIRAVNAAVVDSLMTGIASRISLKRKIKNKANLRDRYDNLLNTKAIETSTYRKQMWKHDCMMA